MAIGDKEVEVAVQVVVEETGTGAPPWVFDAGLIAGKGAAVVAVEDVGAVVGDEEVLIAIAVVVGGLDPEAVSWVGCGSGAACVVEGSLPLILIEVIAR